jgi:hypothetical protein
MTRSTTSDAVIFVRGFHTFIVPGTVVYAEFEIPTIVVCFENNSFLPQWSTDEKNEIISASSSVGGALCILVCYPHTTDSSIRQ